MLKIAPEGLTLILRWIVPFAAVNAVGLSLYWIDKRLAVRKRRRIPERTLLWAAAVAPFGALAGMFLFHHKTRKTKFRTLVPLFAAAHLGWMYFLIRFYFASSGSSVSSFRELPLHYLQKPKGQI